MPKTANFSRKEMLKTLQSTWGYQSFVGNQEEIIESIRTNHDTLAVLPTSAGKSLCYQLPAILMPGLTIVVSPLIALMMDQVRTLLKKDVRVACICSAFLADGKTFYDSSKMTASIRANIYKNILSEDPKEKIKILYISPERIRTLEFIRNIRNAKVSMIAVDEAHCTSVWGHDFRKTYMEIPNIIRLLSKQEKRPVIAAFTATATSFVQKDIIRFLTMKKVALISNDIYRKELHFSNKIIPYEDVLKIIATKRETIESIISEREEQSGIIYCRTIEDVDLLFHYLDDKNYSVTRHHSKLDSTEYRNNGESRHNNMHNFIDNTKRIMVATNAFGMGVDKQDIRYVIHYSLPLSMEDYYQETGRAGREHQDSDCILLYSPYTDNNKCKYLINLSIEENHSLSAIEQNCWRESCLDRLNQMIEYAITPPNDEIHLANKLSHYFKNYTPDVAEIFINSQIQRAKAIPQLFINHTRQVQALRHRNKIEPPKDNSPYFYYTLNESPELSYLDMVVADAVYTLMVYQKNPFSIRDILVILSGNPSIAVGKNDRRYIAIQESVNRLMRVHLLRHNIDEAGVDKTWDLKQFLPLNYINGKYHYSEDTIPPLYKYSETFKEYRTNNQISGFDLDYFYSNSNCSLEDILMTHYLLIRIQSMKTPRHYGTEIELGQAPLNWLSTGGTSTYINFDNMLNNIGIELPNSSNYNANRRKQSLFEHEKKILDHFKSTNIIFDYSIPKLKSSVSYSIKIQLAGNKNAKNAPTL